MALSVWILTLKSCQENLTSHCESWGLPLVKGVIAKEAPTMARSSLISKPLSASTKSLYFKCFSKPLLTVICRSDARSPQHLEMNETVPVGVMATRNSTVMWLL